MTPGRPRLEAFALLGLVASLGCGQPALEEPTPAPLDPVDRSANLTFVVNEAGTEGALAAAALLETTTPTGFLFAEAAAPSLTEDPSFDALLQSLAAAVETTGRALDLAAEVNGLPEGPGPYCFDPDDTAADATLSERADELHSWLLSLIHI